MTSPPPISDPADRRYLPRDQSGCYFSEEVITIGVGRRDALCGFNRIVRKACCVHIHEDAIALRDEGHCSRVQHGARKNLTIGVIASLTRFGEPGCDPLARVVNGHVPEKVGRLAYELFPDERYSGVQHGARDDLIFRTSASKSGCDDLTRLVDGLVPEKARRFVLHLSPISTAGEITLQQRLV
jgi:hypothetical protein